MAQQTLKIQNRQIEHKFALQIQNLPHKTSIKTMPIGVLHTFIS